jgi:DHA2 family multidrug resistance protein
MGQTILLASFERHQHPFIIMMWGVGGVMGPILGPTFGGLVSELLNWRWTFFLILPLGMLACGLVVAALGDQEKGTARRFDATGFLFLAIAVASIQVMFDRGQRNNWFESPEIVIECVLAAVFFSMFLVHVWTARAPLFEPATFADRNFNVGVLLALTLGMLQYTPMVLFPPLLQDLRGYPEGVIGFLVATRGMGNFLSFFIVAQLTRHSPRLCLSLGLAIQALAGLWMGTLDINLSANDVLWTNALHGFGFGLCYTPAAILAFSTLPTPLLTQGNAVFALVRMLGSSLFIALMLLVFAHTVAESSVHLASAVSAFRLDAWTPWLTTFGGIDRALPYDRLAAEIQRQSSMTGYINAFHLMTALTFLAAPLPFLFRTRRNPHP